MTRSRAAVMPTRRALLQQNITYDELGRLATNYAARHLSSYEPHPALPMRLLSDVDAGEWCREHGLTVNDTLASGSVRFEGASTRLRILVPPQAVEAIGLAFMLAMTEVPAFEEARFGGALLWLRRWEIWSESIDRAGYLLLEGLRAATNCSASFDAAPGHLFESGEFASAHAGLALPMLMQWDAHFIPSIGAYAAFISHEGHIDLFTRNDRTQEDMARRFEKFTPELLPVLE